MRCAVACHCHMCQDVETSHTARQNFISVTHAPTTHAANMHTRAHRRRKHGESDATSHPLVVPATDKLT